LQQVAAIYNSPAGCNTPPTTPFLAQQLYFTTPVSGVQRLYQGAEATGYFTLGNLVVQGYYNLTGATAESSNFYFDNPFAITIPGEQLPNVPLQKAGIVLDYKSPHSILEWLADAQHVSSNNPNNLPAYTTIDAGVTAQLHYGTITLAGSNLTNTYSGIFSSPTNAVAFTTAGGYIIPNIARPLTPLTVSATYSVKFGQGVVSQTASTFRPRGGAGGGGGGFFGGGGGPGGPGGGGGNGRGLGSLFSPLPQTPPAEPFAVGGNAATCSADNAPKAKQLASELQAFVAQIEAKRTASGYPATMTAPVLADATITYHGLGTTYALAIIPKAPGMLRAVAGCMPIHIARADDVTQHKLFAPSSPLFFVPQLNFMPAVGMYFVARQQQAGQESFRVYALPTTPPKDPFEIRTATTCTTELRSQATQTMGELRAYFANGTAAASWTITAHTAKSGAWYELEPGDPTVIPAMLACGRVAATTAEDLTKLGFDGKPVPELNYAPSLGLYLIRPNFRQNQASPSPPPPQ
jgi:hypothetical protein